MGVDRSAVARGKVSGHLRPCDPDLTADIQTNAGDLKMVAPEFSGGGLTGSSSEIDAGLGEENG